MSQKTISRDKKRKSVGVAFSPDVRDMLVKIAKKDLRSVSSLIEKIVIAHFEREGIKWSEKG